MYSTKSNPLTCIYVDFTLKHVMESDRYPNLAYNIKFLIDQQQMKMLKILYIVTFDALT